MKYKSKRKFQSKFVVLLIEPYLNVLGLQCKPAQGVLLGFHHLNWDHELIVKVEYIWPSEATIKLIPPKCYQNKGIEFNKVKFG